MYGYTAEEIIGKHLSLLVPEDHCEEVAQVLERISRGERIEHFETVRRRKDGTRVDVSLTISPIVNEEGKVVGVSKIARDISFTKRNQKMLHFLADVSKVMGELLDVNSTLQKVASLSVPQVADWCAIHMLDGCEHAQLVAVAHAQPDQVDIAEHLYREYPPPEDAQYGFRKVMRTGKSELVSQVTDEMLQAAAQSPEHLEVLRKLGLRSLICVPLKTKQSVFGAISFASAESERAYDAADLAMAEDVAHRATIAIENARLYQKVRDADRRKDEFLAMLSHELRNPLAPIRSGLEILSMDPGNHEDAVQLMQEQLEHVVRLVDDLLDVSRIMQGKIELRQVPCEISMLVQRSLEAVRPQIEARQQHLKISVPEEPIGLSADPVRLIQILENLLSNASKYTDKGGHIELSAEKQGPEVVLTVSDSGVGIDPELLPLVFELFTQSNRSLDRAQGGLGIGLTLVQRLVEMHGGTVEAHSEGAGKGSQFIVRLPVAVVDQPVAELPNQVPESPSRRILVVDDNIGAARLLTLLLTKLGDHQVDNAHDGHTALEMAQANLYDIVLLDIGLPGMDGYEVGHRLRQQPETRDVLLVALTGYGRKEDRQKSKEAGFDEHLVKPPSLEQIKAILVHPKLG